MTDDPVVQRVLSAYPRHFRPLHIEPLGNAGGFSGARFWRITSPHGTWCLRRWPAEHPTPDRLRFIHAVLRFGWEQGFRLVPVPLPTAAHATFQRVDAALWQLEPWMPGAPAGRGAVTVVRVREALAALARWHQAVARFPAAAARRGPAPAVAGHLAQIRRWMEGGVGHVARLLDAGGWAAIQPAARQILSHFQQDAHNVCRSLESVRHLPVPLQACARDIWGDHVLFTHDRVTGLIDFGALRTESVAADVARLLGSLAGNDGSLWDAGIAAYTAVRPLSDDERALVRAFDHCQMVTSGMNWIEWIFVDQRRFEDRRAVEHRVEAVLDRLRGRARARHAPVEETSRDRGTPR